MLPNRGEGVVSQINMKIIRTIKIKDDQFTSPISFTSVHISLKHALIQTHYQVKAACRGAVQSVSSRGRC